MTKMNKKELEKLAQDQESRCVSIYLPTHIKGEEVLQHLDKNVLKSMLRKTDIQLQEQGWNKVKSRKFLQPAYEMVNDLNIWKFMSNGMVIFINESGLSSYFLPFKPEKRLYISQEFYLLPLMSLFSGDGDFNLLSLGLKGIELYKGNRESLEKIDTYKTIPKGLEEVVGSDYVQSSLQFRTHQDAYGAGAFHGHGEWKGETKKAEILKYFKEVNNSLSSILQKKNLPLMLAGQDYLVSAYRKTNKYPYLMEEHISGNPKDLGEEGLHEKAWENIFPQFDQQRQQKVDLVQQNRDTSMSSTDINEIYAAAIAGQVDTIFIEKGSEMWGIINPVNNEIRIDSNNSISNISIINMLAKEVISRGGNVYVQSKEVMPLSYAQVNALYRYA